MTHRPIVYSGGKGTTFEIVVLRPLAVGGEGARASDARTTFEIVVLRPLAVGGEVVRASDARTTFEIVVLRPLAVGGKVARASDARTTFEIVVLRPLAVGGEGARSDRRTADPTQRRADSALREDEDHGFDAAQGRAAVQRARRGRAHTEARDPPPTLQAQRAREEQPGHGRSQVGRTLAVAAQTACFCRRSVCGQRNGQTDGGRFSLIKCVDTHFEYRRIRIRNHLGERNTLFECSAAQKETKYVKSTEIYSN